MSALIDAVVAALLSYVFLLLPFAVVVDVAVVRCRANRTQAAGLGRSLLAGLGAGVFLVGFAIIFIVVVQMIDFRSLPKFVDTLALAVLIVVFLTVSFGVGWPLRGSPGMWTPAAAIVGGVCAGFDSPLLLYCSYEVYRHHGKDGSADMFWMMQNVALAHWVAIPIVLIVVVLGGVGRVIVEKRAKHSQPRLPAATSISTLKPW